MNFDIFGYKINISKEFSNQELPQDLKEALKVIERYGFKHGSSEAQKEASRKATETRTNKAKEKIIAAVNILQIENKSISEYAVSKKSGCSINTVKKYRTYIQAQT